MNVYGTFSVNENVYVFLFNFDSNSTVGHSLSIPSVSFSQPGARCQAVTESMIWQIQLCILTLTLMMEVRSRLDQTLYVLKIRAAKHPVCVWRAVNAGYYPKKCCSVKTEWQELIMFSFVWIQDKVTALSSAYVKWWSVCMLPLHSCVAVVLISCKSSTECLVTRDKKRTQTFRAGRCHISL